MVTKCAEVVIVGAGIVGLAHAWLAARSGRKVVVLERRPAAMGASVANFGLLWPIGQPAGERLSLAMRSRTLWLEILGEAKIPHRASGSLHVACRTDEEAVGREFAALGGALGYQCRWLDRNEALAASPALQPEALLGALFSETEIMVDPRQVLAILPEFLSQFYGVHFEWNCAAVSIDDSQVHTPQGVWEAGRVIVCNGADFDNVYPELLRQSGMTCCRLQMMRTQPQPAGWDLGPALAGGLTFRFYPSFRITPSQPALERRIAEETPEYERFGIHTMVSQASSGALTFGDSHEYGFEVSPFSQAEIDELILRHLRSYIRVPRFAIAERWHGVYAKHPDKAYVRLSPEPRTEVVTGLGGAGMTLSFGVAEQTFADHTNQEARA
jgi:D-hydroxyproline dehydrogenase subunit beta